MAANFNEDNLNDQFGHLSFKQHDEKPLEPIEIIDNKSDFKYLDQIILFKNFFFIVDWGKKPCIHVCDQNFINIKKMTSLDQGQYFQSIAIIQMFGDELLGVLTNDDIKFISVKNRDSIEWLEDKEIIFSGTEIERLKKDIQLKFKNEKKDIRCYGLAQDEENIYFVETESRNLITYSNNSNFSINSVQPPKPFKRACFRDLKVNDDHLFLSDYVIKNKNIGNNCIHIFNKNADYITTIGENKIENPYYLSFIRKDEKTLLLVCERKEAGSIKVFEKKVVVVVVENDRFVYEMVKEYKLNCEFPYFFLKMNNYFYLTQIYGNQLSYKGSPKIFKFNLITD